jgi:hypothetical protein
MFSSFLYPSTPGKGKYSNRLISWLDEGERTLKIKIISKWRNEDREKKIYQVGNNSDWIAALIGVGRWRMVWGRQGVNREVVDESNDYVALLIL